MALQVTSSTAPSSPPAPIQRSPWHSPVPYLFGGLAAMLTLIAFALFILAYSYWKHSNETESGNDVNIDLESNRDGNSKPEYYKARPVFEDKYVVIMAGHAQPSFLATPISSREKSFGSSSNKHNSRAKSEFNMTEDQIYY